MPISTEVYKAALAAAPPPPADIANALRIAKVWANNYTPSERTITGKMSLLAHALLKSWGME